MASSRLVLRAVRTTARVNARPMSSTPSRWVDINDRHNDTAPEYRRFQIEKPLNPHLTNTTSTIANEMPNIGKDSPPPELITSVDPKFTPRDSVPENTKHMTGNTQAPGPQKGPNAELDVGEIEGGTFKVEPLRRTGEDSNTLRARLVYQSRKRGTLESDLLLSTFADANLGSMSLHQLQQYDLFLDENDWDIYYWATQEAPITSMAYAEGAGPDHAAPEAQGKDMNVREPPKGEWAQTVGNFKPAYRPVPARWRNSEILSLLRKHVIDRSAGGVQGVADKQLKVDINVSSDLAGTGLGRMPELRNFDR